MKNNSFLSRVIFLILLMVMGGLEANVLLPQQINFNAIKDNNGHHIKYSYVSDEDERGLMWSASLGALFRYDGSRLIRYSVTLPHHHGELKSPIITDIYFHRVDSLYLATNMGLLHFNPITEQFSHFIGQDSNLNPTTGIIRPIRRIVVRNNHQLWLARKDSISLFDTSSNQFVEHINLSHFIKSDGISVMNIAQHQSMLYIATFGLGLLQYDLSTKQLSEVNLGLGNAELNLRNLMLDSSQQLWLGSLDGLFVYDLLSRKLTRYRKLAQQPNSLSDNNIGALFEDSTGRIWVGTHRGINLYRPQSNDFIQYVADSSNPNSPLGGSILSIREGKSGNVYISGNAGVAYFHPDTFAFQYHHINIVDGDYFQLGNIVSLYGNIYMISRQRGLVSEVTLNDQQTLLLSPLLKNILKNNEVFQLYLIDQGLLVRTYKTVYLIDPNKQQPVDLFASWQLGSGYAHPRAIFSDSTGQHYIYAKGGVYRLMNQTLVQLPEALGHREIFISSLENDDDATIDSEDVIWSVWRNQLHRYDLKKQRHHQYDIALTEREVTSIFSSNDHKLWLSTVAKGVLMFAPETGLFESIKGSEKYGRVNVFFQSSLGDIWANSQSGLLRIRANTQEVIHYGLGQGLPSDDVNELQALALGSDQLAISMAPTLNGMVVVKTNEAKIDRRTPTTFIEKLKIDGLGIVINGDKKLLFNNKIKQLQFTITATHPFRADLMVYEHQLVGFDSQPIVGGSDARDISYTNLGPGEYTIAYRAQSINGIWSEIQQINFRVTQPMWLSWWALIGYLILLLLFITLITKWRTRKIVYQKNQLAKMVTQRTLELQQALENTQMFYTSISHEFRTPLTLILGPIEQLKLILNTHTEAIKKLDLVGHNAKQLLKLVDQLLGLAKSKLNQQLPLESIDIKMKLSVIVASLTHLAQVKKINLQFRCSDGLCVRANMEQFEFIMLNLVTNSLKFTPVGGEVSIDAKLDNNAIIIKVIDTGIGLSEQQQQDIFKPFFRVDAQSGQTQGAGIGLLIVQEFTRAIGGEISVNSILGMGSTFVLSLPIHTPQSGGVSTSHAQLSLSSLVQEAIEQEGELIELGVQRDKLAAPVQSSRFKVLVVEDNEQMRNFLTQCLESKFEVISAANGQQGLEKAVELVPDLILSDIMMPVMDGISMCEKLYHHITTQHIPVILLTAKSDPETRIAGLNNKAIDFITKPFDMQVLLLKLDNLLELSQRQQSANQKHVFQPETAIQIGSATLFISAIKACCQEHYADPNFNVAVMAKNMAMSVRKLQRISMANLGLSPNEILRNYRLNIALSMLQANHNVTQSYLDCGFSSASYFSRVFKEYYGYSPSKANLIKTKQ